MQIKIYGEEGSAEYQAAQQLKEVIRKGIKDHEKGRIIIVAGFTCFGQRVKDIDLLVVAQFDQGFKRNINSKAEGDNKRGYIKRNIYFNNFCFCIEVKDHPADQVSFQGERALVKYRGKSHDATNQSEKQKYSLKNYFQEKLEMKIPPHISNFIWFRNVEKPSEISLPHNFLWSNPSLEDLLQLACIDLTPRFHEDKNYHSFSAFNRKNGFVDELARLITFISTPLSIVGQLTRSRLERITKTLLKDQQYAQAVGNKLVVIRGRAGTGKTIKLLHMAYELCEKDHRCLILTYNKALVSDIRRLIALAGIKTDIAAATIEVKTVHSFVYDLLIGFGVYKNLLEESLIEYKDKLTKNLLENNKFQIDKKVDEFKEQFFLENYDHLKAELITYIREGLVTDTDIQKLMTEQQDQVDWDYIFIDEAQDWPEDEKEILFTIFETNKFIVADGVDQLVRGIRRTQWTRSVKYHIDTKGQRKSLRQKTNLCSFVKAYSDQFGLGWDVEPLSNLPGGKIKIITTDYHKDFHEKLMEQCRMDGNQPYEMMFLVPPNLVEKKKVTRKRKGKEFTKVISNFSMKDSWNAMGIELWDGTSSDLRSDYPSKVEEHRVLQYDSSRGLEGWIVVCMEMDEFFEYKFNTFKDDFEGQQSLALFSEEEKALEWAHQWVLIPATRAIDTLVIHIKNRDSRFAQILHDISIRFPDSITWE